MHTYWIILISTLISTPNVPYVNLNIKVWSLCKSPPCLIIMQTTICLIIMQILYSCQSYNVVISIHTKIIFSFLILKYVEYQRDPHVKCISHCICHSFIKLLYISKWILVRRELGTEELGCTSLCTTTMHIELYVCMIYCLLLWTVNAYFT